MEREALTPEALAIAMVKRLADSSRLNPGNVKIPGVLVDCVVVAEKPEHH